MSTKGLNPSTLASLVNEVVNQPSRNLRVAAANGKRKWTSEDLHAELGADPKRKPKPPDGLTEEERWEWDRNWTINRHNERVAEAEARIAERMAR